MKIVRTKCPNRLILNDKYEDKAAQEIINKKFGKTFETSGYARQSNMSSFMIMSPTDKLLFLEKFAFENINLREIKAKCKANILSTNKTLISATSQLVMATQILEEMEKPHFVKCPLKCSSKNRDKAIKNENIRLKNSIILAKKRSKAKYLLEKQLTESKVLRAVLDTNNSNLAKLNQKIDNVNEEINSINFIGAKKLLSYKNELEKLHSHKKLLELNSTLIDYTKKLKDMKKAEKQAHDHKLNEINEKIWDQYTESETEDTISDLDQCIKEITRLKSIERDIKNIVIPESSVSIKNSIERIEEELEKSREIYNKIKIERSSYVCPCCKANLSVREGELVQIKTEQLQKDVNIRDVAKIIKELTVKVNTKNKNFTRALMLEHKLKEYESDKANIVKNYETIPDIEELTEDLDYMKNYKIENKSLFRKQQELVNIGPFSKTCVKFEEETNELREKIKMLSSKNMDVNFDIDEHELRKTIMSEQNKKVLLDGLKENLNIFSTERLELNEHIESVKNEYIEKYPNNDTINELENKISEVDGKIRDCKLKKEKQLVILEQIKVWKEYEKEVAKYNSWVAKVKDLKSIEEKATKKHASFLQLKEKILQAESIALQNIIDSINSHARVYLDDFFPEDPISVELHAFKENKKKTTKPSINVRIEYKSMECGLNMLSGGEMARVVLAYTLALAEMFGTPLLLLDECTASLDQEMSGIVFESIKDHFNGKVALIIAHQVVSGVFDKVIIL
jgi:DNA repair exonuclease SbcCD ATPase subunit